MSAPKTDLIVFIRGDAMFVKKEHVPDRTFADLLEVQPTILYEDESDGTTFPLVDRVIDLPMTPLATHAISEACMLVVVK